MTIRTKYQAWGGGATAGDLVTTGNNGGGYPSSCSHFIKFLDASGNTLTESVGAVSTGAHSAGLTWDAAKGAAIATSTGTTSLTITDPSANEDYVFIAIVEPTDGDFACHFGAAGLSKGFAFTDTSATFRNDIPTTEVCTFGTATPFGEAIAIYLIIDDSAATLSAGWISSSSSDHQSESAMTGGSATSFTDTLTLASGTFYSIASFNYPEGYAPTLAKVKTAAEWMLTQHTSAECKADPTKRIVYPAI